MDPDTTSFATLFKKYRLLSGFATIGEFADALAEQGPMYDESLFSHWQRGTRMPQDRQAIIALIELFISRNAIKKTMEANELLESAGYGYLTNSEVGNLTLDSDDLEIDSNKSFNHKVGPVEISQLRSNEVRSVFKYTFTDFPRPFIENDQLDAVFVTGVGSYELHRLTNKQKKAREAARAFKPCSEYVHTALFPVIASFQQRVGTDSNVTMSHFSDSELSENIIKNHNIICLSGGDVNSFTSKVLTEFEQTFGICLPIRFTDIGTSECIFSSLSNKYYSERSDVETGVKFVAFLMLIPNPWNKDKVILMAAGNRVLGTVGALHLIDQALGGNQVIDNHPLNPNLPARIISTVNLDDSGKRVTKIRFLE